MKTVGIQGNELAAQYAKQSFWAIQTTLGRTEAKALVEKKNRDNGVMEIKDMFS